MSKIKIPLKNRLITRIFISHILLASIPIIITGIVLTRTSRHAIEDTVMHRNLEFAKRASLSISKTLEQAHKVLRSNAENIVNFQLSRIAQEILINNIAREFDVFKQIYVFNKSGKIEISTHYVDNENQILNRDFTQYMQEGFDHSSEVLISEDKMPYIEIAEPIYFVGDTVGILFAKVNLKVMWDLIDSSKVGLRGQAFIFDRKGTYIAHSDRKKVYTAEKFKIKTILEDIARNMGGNKIYKDEYGESMIAAYVALPMMKWGIVIQQPIREAFKQARTMRMQIIGMALSSIFIASLIAYFYSRKIVEPIDRLINGVQEFSIGNLAYRIQQTGKDEIATLIDQFNQMAVQLNEYQNKLKRVERIETLSKMAAVLSHEIKNPLNAMVINMQIQKKELSSKDINKKKFIHFHNIVASEIMRLDKMVNNFLLVAIPPELKKEAFIVQDILKNLIIEQENHTIQKNVEVSTQFHPKPLKIFVDESRLKQAFLNIYINAIQAMPEGGPLRISISPGEPYGGYAETKMVKISFQDRGYGISPDSIKHIFDFYYTTKKGGTGLGLAIAQQIIDEHDGRIEVQSIVGQGTTFSIFLPLIQGV